MPELPELEATARLIGQEVSGATVESALAPGINVMKSFKPPLDSLAGDRIESIGRRGKLLIIEFGSGVALLTHLMSAGKLQVHTKRAGPKDRTSRVLVRLEDGRELRIRESGTHQRAWAKLMPRSKYRPTKLWRNSGPMRGRKGFRSMWSAQPTGRSIRCFAIRGRSPG